MDGYQQLDFEKWQLNDTDPGKLRKSLAPKKFRQFQPQMLVRSHFDGC